MIELKDITLREYFELENKEEYDFAIKYATKKNLYNDALDVFNTGDFTHLKFGLIKDLQYDLEHGIVWSELIDYFEKLTGKKANEIASYKLLTLCRYKAYVTSEIERINTIENELLSYLPTSDEVAAGIEEFNKFGVYGQKRKLAITFGITTEQIDNMKYSDCLLELYYQKTEYEYSEKLTKIKQKKH